MIERKTTFPSEISVYLFRTRALCNRQFATPTVQRYSKFLLVIGQRAMKLCGWEVEAGVALSLLDKRVDGG